MKKKILVPVACLLLIGASFGVTYAYLTGSSSKTNAFTPVENKIEIEEDFTKPDKLEMGMKIDKVVKVTNTGSLTCFVRARVDFSDSQAKEFCDDLIITETQWKKANDEYYYYVDPLAPGDVTKPLFNFVQIKSSTDEELLTKYDKNQDGELDDEEIEDILINFDVYVYAESREQNAAAEEDENDKRAGYMKAWGLYDDDFTEGGGGT